MSIDEAITKHKEIAKRYKILADSDELVQKSYCTEFDKYKYIKSAEEHEQLAEWLKELKAIKSNGRYVQGNKAGQKIGYNKAIDDCMNKLCDHCMQQTNECYKLECPFCTDGCDIVNIAEQLKAGVGKRSVNQNENYNKEES